jgi:starch synthase
MHIVFAASECVPFAKTGGLADVVGALPVELVRLGHQVTVYLPLYSVVRPHIQGEYTYAVRSITIPFLYYNRFAGIVDGGLRDGVQHYFVDCPELFDRPGLYGDKTGDYPDNAERFGAFCRAVLEATKQLGVPDLFHVHDWEAALIPIYLRTVYYFDPALRNAGTILTIHNAGYQGWFPPNTIEKLLLPWDIFTMDRVEHFNHFNCLKGGLAYSDRLTTVSRKYAQEIQTQEFGHTLEPALRRRAADLRGILNGIDYSLWDPATDKSIAACYTPENLAGKALCRADLIKRMGLTGITDTTAILGIVSRFVQQKGLDFVMEIANELDKREVAVTILGSGDLHFETFFRTWAARRPGKVAVLVGYDELLAHKIEAGADIFLMPSRYEPCGLNQIYSLKYGTVPVVRATGGLDDTIQEWDALQCTGTGFKFQGLKALGFLEAIDRALAAFQQKNSWTQLMRNGMNQDFGWKNPAREYAQLYEEIIRLRS